VASGGESAGGGGAERKTLDGFLADVRRVRSELGPTSTWQPTLEVLEEEIESGQPLFFKFERASSSKSIKETPAVS